MAYTISYSLALGSSMVGIGADLRAQLVTTTGANAGSAISTGFVEIGAGNYLWTGAVPAGHRGGVKFYRQSTSAVMGFASINPEREEYEALIKAKTDTLGAGIVQVTSPVLASGAITIYAGYDMTAANGLALDFYDPGDWPDLTGAAVHFAGYFYSAFRLDGVVMGAGGPDQVVRFEPLAEQTADLVKSENWLYDVYVVLASTEVRPLVKDGKLEVTVRLG